MSINKALKILKKKKLILVLGVLLGVVLAMFGTFFMDLEYKTSASFIVIQEQRFADSFTQAKSAEYLSGILSQIVDTDSFRSLVLAKNPKIAGILPQNASDRRKEWSRMIKAQAKQDSGILDITAYNKDPRASSLILNAVGDALTSNTAKYLGNSANIKLIRIDGPVTSEFPVRPNFALNLLAGALIGGMLFSCVLLIKNGTQNSTPSVDPSYLARLTPDHQSSSRSQRNIALGRSRPTKRGANQDFGELIKATRALSAKL